MCQNHKQVSLGFATESYPAGAHMCLIYNSESQRRDVIAKFLQEGLESGEKVGYATDLMKPEQIRQWLAGRGIEAPDKNRPEQLTITEAKQVYYPDGTFVPEDMLEGLGDYYQQAIDDGYTGLRVTGETSWAKKGIPGSDRLIEYENAVNKVLTKYGITAIYNMPV
ncbi:MAG: hypothetical protein FVQ80_01260 [Planctomycetes bacterium]|nr:hypothetical protein [Planctomycetota bacterium]